MQTSGRVVGGCEGHIEVVLHEALHVHSQVGRQPQEAVPPAASLDVMVHSVPVVLVQQLEHWDLQGRAHLLVLCLTPNDMLKPQAATTTTSNERRKRREERSHAVAIPAHAGR